MVEANPGANAQGVKESLMDGVEEEKQTSTGDHTAEN